MLRDIFLVRGRYVVGSHVLGKFGFGFKLVFEINGGDALDWWAEWQLWTGMAEKAGELMVGVEGGFCG